MNTGIRILIERMKTNPEEWASMTTRGRGRWEAAVHEYWDYFTEEDQIAYKEARNALLQDEFTERVMKTLAGDDNNDGVSLTSALHPTPQIGALRMNYSTNQYEVFSGKSWQVVDPAQQALRVSTQNNDINQLQNAYQKMQQYGACGGAIGGGAGGGAIGSGAGGGSMLSNLAKNLGFK